MSLCRTVYRALWLGTGINVHDSEIIFAAEESPEGGYEARALGHAIFTQADTLEDLRAMVQDAVRCHFDEADRPQVIGRR